MTEIVLVTDGTTNSCRLFDSDGRRFHRVQELQIIFEAGGQTLPRGLFTYYLPDEENPEKVKVELGPNGLEPVSRTVHADVVRIEHPEKTHMTQEEFSEMFSD